MYVIINTEWLGKHELIQTKKEKTTKHRPYTYFLGRYIQITTESVIIKYSEIYVILSHYKKLHNSSRIKRALIYAAFLHITINHVIWNI